MLQLFVQINWDCLFKCCAQLKTQLQQIPQNKSKQQTKKQKQKDSARTDNQDEGEAETEAEEKEDWGSVHDSMIAGAKPTPTHSGESCLGGA